MQSLCSFAGELLRLFARCLHPLGFESVSASKERNQQPRTQLTNKEVSAMLTAHGAARSKDTCHSADARYSKTSSPVCALGKWLGSA